MNSLVINDSNSAKLGAAGAFEAVAGALCAHSANGDIQQQASAALQNMAANNDIRATWIAAGGQEALITVLQACSFTSASDVLWSLIDYSSSGAVGWRWSAVADGVASSRQLEHKQDGAQCVTQHRVM
jgi:hypothetical protein